MLHWIFTPLCFVRTSELKLCAVKEMTTTVIKEFSSCSPAGHYALFKDVYSSSDGMSENLEDKYPDLVSRERDMTVLLNLPDAIALAAEIDNKLVAYLTIRPRPQSRLRHTADLNMGVAREFRGHGLGRGILQAGLDRARAAPGLEIVYLMVRADNTPAIHLYQQAGFDTLTVLHRDTKVCGSYFDGILMRKFVDT